jgi:predicted DNA-binding transcriptional regulator YafY
MVGPPDRSTRVSRLEQLKGLLAQRDTTTAGELASELGISVRTLHRDLAVLRDLGVPIDSDRGRGGGLRLEQGWSLGRVHLNEAEAISLLLSLAIAEKIGSPLLLDDLRSTTRKVAAAFAPAQTRRIMALRRRILIGTRASTEVLASYSPPSPAVTAPLLQAYLHQRLAQMSYRDRHGVITDREIEPQYLYYNLPVWYVQAWDRMRDDVRSFRIDRIGRLEVLPVGFRLRRADAFLHAGEVEAHPI